MQVDRLHAVTLPRLEIISVTATLQVAARALCRPGIGLLIACGKGGMAQGVLTKSDLVRQLALAATPDDLVAPLIGRDVVSCRAEDNVYEVWQMMTVRKLQNVPVLDVDLRPLGVLDIRDAMHALFEAEQYQERALVDYIAGIGYR
jgi:signal-transduction protein with cAMP-binding, CBS, and nucleotidyltransferase domain